MTLCKVRSPSYHHKVPKGDQFLPGVSTEDLAALYRTEKNIKARDRLLAFIQRREGKTVHAIAKNLHRAPAAIYDWLGRSKDGLDDLQDIKRKGPERRLTEEQLAELREDLMAGPRAHGFESGLWTGKLLMAHVLKIQHPVCTPYHAENAENDGVSAYETRAQTPKGRL